MYYFKLQIRIPKATPLAIIRISGLYMKESGPVMKTLELGIFDYIQNPSLRELAEVGPR